MPPTHISHYALTDRLGERAYGDVWKVISVRREERMALNRMDPQGADRTADLVVRDGVVATEQAMQAPQAAPSAGDQPVIEEAHQRSDLGNAAAALPPLLEAA
jgi:hypothetical protein